MKSIKAMAVATSLLVLSSSAVGLVGCGPQRGVTVDGGKTQLTVKYYNGGNGQVWLDKLIENFEATYAETSFEEGKKGVQILKDFEKKNLMASQIRDYSADVFMMEHVSYDEAIAKDALLDITDVVTGNASKLDGTKESKTIEAKFNADSKDYYARQKDGKTAYYGIPLFSGWHDMIYNMEVFEKNGYLFNSASDTKLAEFDEKYATNSPDLANWTYISQYFTADKTDLSKGADGKEGTDDDGLPATYAEFKMLLECIAQTGTVTPFIFNGNAHHYFATWGHDIWADYEGVDNMMMNLNLSSGGKAVDNLVTVAKQGDEWVETAVAPVEITPANAYLLQQQKGKLQALRFLEMILSDSRYYEEDAFTSSLMHTDAQNYFINGNTNEGKEYAILMDGNWWNTEAKLYFKNDSFSTAKFGIIPVPKADATHVGEGQTRVDGYISNMFIKSTIAQNKVKVAKEFLAYVNSDEAMNVFSQYTQSVRNMNYTIEQSTLDNMTEFGRQVARMYMSDDFNVISWVPRTAEAQKNTAYLEQLTYGWSSKSYGADNPLDTLHKTAGLTAEAYFKDINDKWDAVQWAITYLK